MNDRFKYRYYHEKTNKIYDVCFIDFDCPYVSVYISDEELLHVGKRDFKWKNLIQSTGLKDKNDKLIYEADILKDKYGALHPISWNKKGFLEADTFAVAGFYNAIQEDMEVVGNIYENKELLDT